MGRVIRYENIYYGNKEPGDLGFDPLRLGANPTSLAYYKVCHFYSLIVDVDGCRFVGKTRYICFCSSMGSPLARSYPAVAAGC